MWANPQVSDTKQAGETEKETRHTSMSGRSSAEEGPREGSQALERQGVGSG